ncbi:uncharacterized protein DNG_09917 [Cephalotrichum gorgonifer]|uniref:Uncharacterized protein n=1 Tax=Cephalotrichum gorgonifer TaxID=2041049 RepID=A0AAE8N8C3_9PEZI|nr:uncharacterized protein DNG_09917 [Cephalotrichum gorgonifer]
MATASIADLEARLTAYDFNYQELKDALDGKALPTALGRPVARACVIRGIRYHDTGFAEPLRSLVANYPELTRALNARSIMSGAVPSINATDEVPYCIWHPDTAPEQTYRDLWAKYCREFPLITWAVARACATAGSVNLYRELNLVPCVEVAEEARESDCPGSNEIYEIIVRQAIRYSVMDDYTRTIHEPRAGAFLNGDTQVRYQLDYRSQFMNQKTTLFGDSDDSDDEDYGDVTLFGDAVEGGLPIFDITEDMLVGIGTTRSSRPPHDFTDLLVNPLPADLPVLDKTILTHMAAYNGNIDRYARLRRPATEMAHDERMFVIRGIYHHPLFGAWWARHTAGSRGLGGAEGEDVRRAIHARAIMSNDLTRITADTPDNELPYCIWYPDWPHQDILRTLLRRKPKMLPQIARTCVIADHETLWSDIIQSKALLEVPEKELFYMESEARITCARRWEGQTTFPSYLRDIESTAAERGIKIHQELVHSRDWKAFITRRDKFESGSMSLYGGGWSGLLSAGEFPGAYNGVWVRVSHVELTTSADPAARPVKVTECFELNELYQDVPLDKIGKYLETKNP